MEISVDINEVNQFVQSDEFINFLLSHTTNIGTPGFILQTLLDKIDEVKAARYESIS